MGTVTAPPADGRRLAGLAKLLAALRSGALRLVLPALLGALMGSGSASAASWLDTAPADWNVPGAAVPRAPSDTELYPQCRASERAATSPEERQLANGGWLLQRSWLSRRTGDVALVEALAGYDGMCRAVEYNVFVFAGGQFAGTLSPALMNAREDGQLAARAPEVQDTGAVIAWFERYRAKDELCCPSGGTTKVEYELHRMQGLPVLSATRVGKLGRADARRVGAGALKRGDVLGLAVALMASAALAAAAFGAGRVLLRRA